MEQEFVNKYVENIMGKLVEALKKEILLQTQLELAQKAVKNLTEENEKLKATTTVTDKQENTF
jgi:hypothetical protein